MLFDEFLSVNAIWFRKFYVLVRKCLQKSYFSRNKVLATLAQIFEGVYPFPWDIPQQLCNIKKGCNLSETVLLSRFCLSVPILQLFPLLFSAAKELKKTQKATTKKSAPAAAAPKAAKAAKAAQKAQKPMQKAAPRVGGKR